MSLAARQSKSTHTGIPLAQIPTKKDTVTITKVKTADLEWCDDFVPGAEGEDEEEEE